MTITLTKDQDIAYEGLKKWLFNGDTDKQLFEIAGYAGTGKSTLVNYAIENFEAEDRIKREDFAFATYTGKASLVLQRKGIESATTIHRLIYNCYVEASEDPKTGKIVKKMKFTKKTPEALMTTKFIVIDECSMVDEKILNDLKSFGKKIIVLGDNGQLPPIKAKAVLLQNPDYMLKQITRQAENSPIIYLSKLIREGKKIPLGRLGKDVIITDNIDLITDKTLRKAEVVICGKNRTRDYLNNKIRKIYLGETSGFLPIKDDKLICRKNNWEEITPITPLINGLIGYVHNHPDREHSNFNRKQLLLDFRPEFIDEDNRENIFNSLKVDIRRFDPGNSQKIDEIRFDKESDSELFEFGYAITCHLAQGSEWSKAVIYDEPIGNWQDQIKWRYTAVTRSSEKLVYVL